MAIPASIDDVTAEWLAAVTGFDIRGITIDQIGAGVGVSSALYRVTLEGSDCPTTVVVKLPALDENAVFTSTILRMYIREVAFFTELADQAPVRVPEGYYAAVDPETSQFVAVMEDMGAMRICDQIEGMQLTDAERAIDELAQWHATWWGQGDDLAARGLTVSLADPIYPAILPMVFDEGWQKITSEMEVAQEIRDIAPGWSAAMPRLLTDLSSGTNTMVHGDYRGDNILFNEDGSVVLLDFQLIGTGTGAYDLAYMVTQSLDVDIAASHERELFNRWLDGLAAAGVSYDADQAWLDYRKAALFCLVYPVVASRGMDLSDKRQHDLIDVMNTRYARAARDLKLAELL